MGKNQRFGHLDPPPSRSDVRFAIRLAIASGLLVVAVGLVAALVWL